MSDPMSSSPSIGGYLCHIVIKSKANKSSLMSSTTRQLVHCVYVVLGISLADILFPAIRLIELFLICAIPIT
jgi:hypothetical protein